MTAPVHEARRAKGLLPVIHLVDAGCVGADRLIDAQAEHGIERVGPVRPDTSGQDTPAKATTSRHCASTGTPVP